MSKKIKVIWICNFSNSTVRKAVQVRKLYYARIISWLFHKPFVRWNDYGAWITNGINEFEKLTDQVELTVIFPFFGQRGSVHHFTINGINYYSFRPQDDSLIGFLLSRTRGSKTKRFDKNSSVIKDIVDNINPDILHYIGVEKPIYASSALIMPRHIAQIAQLQTLLSDPDIIKNYPQYEPYIPIEKEILINADYIGTRIQRFEDIIINEIKPTARFIHTSLAVREVVKESSEECLFDFVYFSANINKAADLAIEAFAIAVKAKPEISLDIVGGYTPDYKAELEKRIEELGIQGSVTFEGSLPTHDDVINQIRKSRFALLPLKTDIVSSTIREALSNSIPVVTTITPGTPKLNEKEQCVLLSETGDHQAMANNMLRLLNERDLAATLATNGRKIMEREDSNFKLMVEWVETYKNIISNLENHG